MEFNHEKSNLSYNLDSNSNNNGGNKDINNWVKRGKSSPNNTGTTDQTISMKKLYPSSLFHIKTQNV